MKKVLIVQNIGNNYGGVWQVNKFIGEELIKQGYDVTILSVRNYTKEPLEHNKKLHVSVINDKDEWGTFRGMEIIAEIKTLHFIKAIKMILSRIKYNISIKKDSKKMHKFISDYKPNYIITSHYELIDMIPKEYLNITIHEQHSSVESALSHRATTNTFLKYKDKIKFLFLTKTGMEYAKNIGITNSTYIYNAVRFKSNKISNVIDNKKLITIARLSKEKDLISMVKIVKEVFKDKKFKDWAFEIYGSGDEYDNIKKEIDNHKQIKLMGLTNDPKEKLLSASINLNTSPFEGFCLSILEANECGVPTVSFNFGESANEEIIDEKTGLIAKDFDDYVNKLKNLMSDKNKLLTLSKNCKEYNNNFQIEKIITKWLALFKEIDKE